MMRIGIISALTLVTIGAGLNVSSGPAVAQSPRFNCVNESLDINVERQSMASALQVLSAQTRCPISQDAPVAGLTANFVQGVYTPVEALAALVDGQGLEAHSIRQGLSVTRAEVENEDVAQAYDCQNDAIRIDIPANRLDEALDVLSYQTSCPISLDFQVSGLRSRRVSGVMTPIQALRVMLGGTGLKGRQVRQGLSVEGTRR